MYFAFVVDNAMVLWEPSGSSVGWIFVGDNLLRGWFDHIGKQCNPIEVVHIGAWVRIWDERSWRVALLPRSEIWEEEEELWSLGEAEVNRVSVCRTSLAMSCGRSRHCRQSMRTRWRFVPYRDQVLSRCRLATQFNLALTIWQGPDLYWNRDSNAGSKSMTPPLLSTPYDGTPFAALSRYHHRRPAILRR